MVCHLLTTEHGSKFKNQPAGCSLGGLWWHVKVVEAVELSRKTLKKIKQNLWWAFMYNIVSATYLLLDGSMISS
jgi:hypothetical protein